MRVFLLLVILLVNVRHINAQTYQPNWESLDSRPTPQWWKDAKFGIFIHWGVYAVPGWSSKGNYAEWYQQGLQTTDSARKRFHQQKFGDRTYYQLAEDFKAELYNPDEWAKLFEKSGAKYIVLTSKHHDGFTLWPNKNANRTWGFPWNAMDIGPRRDLLGDLFKSVRKTSVRAGMYYSLYEWFNPLWLNNKPAYVQEHMWPQMMELINTYQPDVFWTDGEWDAPAELWKSKEFLTWLFNESPVKEKIVVNDRWGSGIRFKHGGFFTPEYQPDLDFENHDWEESRGMGYSYGYNREEDAWDYNSTQSLVIALIDKVSRGGNFLLDIGPDEHGKIPPIMQERLLQMGEWLSIHGEAIYNTVRWKTAVQWSEGRRDYKFKNTHAVTEDWKTGGDVMLKLTVDPDPGYAVKEIFYTYNPTTNCLYAIFPRYPDNRTLVLKDMQLPTGTKISFLSHPGELKWKQDDNNIIIKLPEYNPNKIKLNYAYAIKIENYGRFAAKPVIKVSYGPGSLVPDINVVPNHQPGMNALTRFTIDGSEPTENSPDKIPAFKQSFVLKAKNFANGLLPSGTVTENINVYRWKNAVKPGKPQNGLKYEAFELNPVSVKDMEGQTAVKLGYANKVDPSLLTRKENAGLRFEGYIRVEKDDIYTFYLASDDGSRLTIDGEEIIDHDGLHGADEKQGTVALRKGYHKIKIEYIQASGGLALRLQIAGADGQRKSIAAEQLYH
jgi:alpha-L-fucosidase